MIRVPAGTRGGHGIIQIYGILAKIVQIFSKINPVCFENIGFSEELQSLTCLYVP